MSWFRWLRPPSVRERLAPYNLRPDVLAAAAIMASDQRSDRPRGAAGVLSH